MDDLALPSLILVALGVGAGAIVQGSVGFGFALVAVPALSLVRPEAVPVTILLLAGPLTIVMATRERHAIDLRGFAWITTGRLAGTAGGVLVLTSFPAGSLSALFGGLILLAVLLSLTSPAVELSGRTRVVAGFASGVMGTAGAVGGPPLALAYQRRPGPELRSTLALSFVVGVAFSLIGLAIAGRVLAWQAILALKLAPAVIGGLALSPFVRRILEARLLRATVLVFASVSGAAALARGLLG